MQAMQLLKPAVLVMLVLVSPLLLAGPDNLEKINKLKYDIRSLKKTLIGTGKSQKFFSNELKKSELALADLNLSLHNIRGKLQTFNLEIKDLHALKSNLSARLQSQKKLVKNHIISMHRQGNQESARLLLSQRDLHTANRTLLYYHYFLRARGHKISTYKKTITELKIVHESILSRKKELTKNHSDLEKIKGRLLAVQEKREKAIKNISKKINSSKIKINTLAAQQKRLESILLNNKLTIQTLSPYAAEKTFIANKGKLPWPVIGYLSNRYSALPVSDLHSKGWLLKTKEGAHVNAVHDGQIIFSGYLKGHGLLVIVDHGDGYMTLYAHNQVLFKKMGDWVLKGEEISRAGNSGGQKEHALYFEVRKNGMPTNPKLWLTKKSS